MKEPVSRNFVSGPVSEENVMATLIDNKLEIPECR